MPEHSGAPRAVFLSYASEDADAATRICEALRAAGVEVWFDRDELRGGDSWDSKIKKQIHDCALFVPLISAHTNARLEGYFRREWNLATRRLLDMAHDAALLVPVVIDQTREAEARVPEEFLRAQWTRLPGGETPPAFARRVRQLLGIDLAPVPSAKATATGVVETSTQSPVSLRRRSTPLPRWFGLAVTALLLVLGAGTFWYYQRADDSPTAKQELAKVAPSVPVAPNDKSIAVLPFVDMSAQKNQEYMADGIAEELLNMLAQTPELKVIARTSSFAFKGQNIDIADIAKKLNVTHVLEGSVRTSGNKMRITAQLIRASDSSRLWSQTFDQQMTDVFEVQREIATAVVSELRMTLLSSTSQAARTDPQTYALFLQGREISRQATKESFEKSNSLFHRVLELDPKYVAALEGLAYNYFSQSFYGFVPVDEGMRLAREATNKALTLGQTRALTHLQLYNIASYYDLNQKLAARHLEEALALEPSNADVLLEASIFMRRLGRLDEAIAIAEYQVSLDPINPGSYESLQSIYRAAGRFQDAVAASHTLLSLSPNFSTGRETLGEIFLQQGDAKAALIEMQREAIPGQRLIGSSMAYYALGKKAESDSALAEAMQTYGKVYPFQIAYALAFRGEADRAFEWLERAAQSHDLYFVAVTRHAFLANLHTDPRWLPFLRRHGMAPDQLAAIKFEVKLPQ